MKIDMNKDFDEAFPDTVAAGLTLKEWLVAAFAFLIAIGVVVLVWYLTGLSITVSVYFGIPVMAPIMFLGIYKYQGAFLTEIIKAAKYQFQTRKLAFEGEEYKERRNLFVIKRGK